MGKVIAEKYIFRNFDRILAILLFLVLSLKMFESNISQSFILNEDRRLRISKLMAENDLKSLESFYRNLLNNSDLIGKKLQIPNNLILGNNVKIVSLIKTSDHDRETELKINRIVVSLANKYNNITKLYFYDHEHEKSEISDKFNDYYDLITDYKMKIDLGIFEFIDVPSLIIIGRNNEIMTSFSFTYLMSDKERILIKDYLLKILEENNS